MVWINLISGLVSAKQVENEQIDITYIRDILQGILRQRFTIYSVTFRNELVFLYETKQGWPKLGFQVEEQSARESRPSFLREVTNGAVFAEFYSLRERFHRHQSMALFDFNAFVRETKKKYAWSPIYRSDKEDVLETVGSVAHINVAERLMAKNFEQMAAFNCTDAFLFKIAKGIDAEKHFLGNRLKMLCLSLTADYTAPSALFLIDGLQHLKCLNDFSLIDILHTTSVDAVGDFLAKTTSLKRLYLSLSWASCKQVPTIALANGLRSNKSLTSLNLMRFSIDFDKNEPFVNAVCESATLQRFSFRCDHSGTLFDDCKNCDKTAHNIILKSNLKDLELPHGCLNQHSSLQYCMFRNVTLTEINVYHHKSGTSDTLKAMATFNKEEFHPQTMRRFFLNLSIDLFSYDLAPYVLLEIIDWLPRNQRLDLWQNFLFSDKVCRDWKVVPIWNRVNHLQKINLLYEIAASIRKVVENRTNC